MCTLNRTPPFWSTVGLDGATLIDAIDHQSPVKASCTSARSNTPKSQFDADISAIFSSPSFIMSPEPTILENRLAVSSKGLELLAEAATAEKRKMGCMLAAAELMNERDGLTMPSSSHEEEQQQRLSQVELDIDSGSGIIHPHDQSFASFIEMHDNLGSNEASNDDDDDSVVVDAMDDVDDMVDAGNAGTSLLSVIGSTEDSCVDEEHQGCGSGIDRARVETTAFEVEKFVNSSDTTNTDIVNCNQHKSDLFGHEESVLTTTTNRMHHIHSVGMIDVPTDSSPVEVSCSKRKRVEEEYSAKLVGTGNKVNMLPMNWNTSIRHHHHGDSSSSSSSSSSPKSNMKPFVEGNSDSIAMIIAAEKQRQSLSWRYKLTYTVYVVVCCLLYVVTSSIGVC